MGTSDQVHVAFEIMEHKIPTRLTTNYTSVHKHSSRLSNDCNSNSMCSDIMHVCNVTDLPPVSDSLTAGA
jgi:hypothetical protein